MSAPIAVRPAPGTEATPETVAYWKSLTPGQVAEACQLILAAEYPLDETAA